MSELHVRTPLSALEEHWLLAASSRELGDAPLGRTVLGRSIVLFRDASGAAVALEDRCPHRHVSLSKGCVQRGTIACPYHGWRFDGRGACVHVPSALDGEKLPKATVATFAVREQDESVWVWIGSGAPTREPPRWPHAEMGGFATHEVVTVIDCALLPILDNFVDTAHTGIVHRGLFRGPPSKPVRARIEELATGVRIETLGESDPDSVAGRLTGGERIEHFDEVILPYTVRVDYRWGTSRHVLTTSICTPETATRTRVFTRVSVRFGRASAMLVRALIPLTERVLAQDKDVLEDQAAQLAKHGATFRASTIADAPTIAVTRAFEAYCEHRMDARELRTRDVEYRL
ncbi:Rieske 2Fe-2S domain-containing protein [Sandaracinus amylolyticus]|uniref:Rieske 2Fe-2S domain-containing protein n=1 Tax=Sandaracinus amylolyticus TaxID=927083 RepID=UPI001F277AB5|nr:Rieske 2Fe-2S domain-containing protein [Sandaracinus amylolyticus]UJR82584.1 Hypothetical protein I5071_46490 [Sandaracinus amylolyticus]